MRHISISIDQLDYTKPVSYYAKLFGIPHSTLKRKLQELGVFNRFLYSNGENTRIIKVRQLREEYYQNPKVCKFCGKHIAYESKKNDFCSRSCAHKGRYLSEETRRRQGEEIKRRIKEGTWKKPNPPRVVSERTSKECEYCGSPMSLRPSEIGRKFCSRTCASKGLDRTNCGGYRENAGTNRGKAGWYKGYYCSSSWELAWVIYNLDHGISFKRNTEGFPYFFKKKSRLYYPDFRLPDGSYVEIKGYKTAQWEAKVAHFPHQLKVLYKKELIPILQYVENKFGKDFIRLYDGNPHNKKTNQCEVCGEPCRKIFCSRKCAMKRNRERCDPDMRKKPRKKKPFIHGTLRCFKNGCKCDLCREARNAEARAYRARRKQSLSSDGQLTLLETRRTNVRNILEKA